MIKSLIAKLRNFPYTWWMGFATGRIASANATQRHWADTVAALAARAQNAEKRANFAEGQIEWYAPRYAALLYKTQRLEAMLETRNLNGGFMPK